MLEFAKIENLRNVSEFLLLKFCWILQNFWQNFGKMLTKKWDYRAVQRSALCRSRRELSNAYFIAKFGLDTAENEPCQVCPLSAYRSPRCRASPRDRPTETVTRCPRRRRRRAGTHGSHSSSATRPPSRHRAPPAPGQPTWRPALLRARLSGSSGRILRWGGRARWKLNGKLNVRGNEN